MNTTGSKIFNTSLYLCLVALLLTGSGFAQTGLIPSGSTGVLRVSGSEEDAFQRSYVCPPDLRRPDASAVEKRQRDATSSDLESVGAVQLSVMRKAPYLIYPGVNTEMRVMWQLSLTETCTIEWGTDTLYSLGSEQTLEYGSDHQHTYTITGLTPGNLYYYRVTVEAEEYAGSFRSAPADDATTVKFIAYGDTRTYPANHNQVASAIVSTYAAEPDFQSVIISVGDLVGDGDVESDWDNQFFDPAYTNIQEMLAHLPYQSAMGNHEGSGLLFTKYFPYPFVGGRYWSYDYGPAHFVVVDQYTSYGSGSVQLNWIENDLASTTKPWKFIYLHEPGWSAGGHGNNATVQYSIQPLCEQYGVSILFAGHNHYYARAVVNGVQHITTGGGGAPLYDPNLSFPNIVTATKAYHFCKIEIDGGFLRFTAVTPQATMIDSFTLSLPGAAIEPVDKRLSWQGSRLDAASPNPFNLSTTISFSIPRAAAVRLSIFDIQGQRIRTVVDAELEPGSHDVVWRGDDDGGRPVSPGVYFCLLETENYTNAKKLVLMR